MRKKASFSGMLFTFKARHLLKITLSRQVTSPISFKHIPAADLRDLKQMPGFKGKKHP